MIYVVVILLTLLGIAVGIIATQRRKDIGPELRLVAKENEASILKKAAVEKLEIASKAQKATVDVSNMSNDKLEKELNE